MKKVILTPIVICLGALALSIPACNSPKPEVTPVASGLVVASPTPTAAPSIWANLNTSLAAFNSQVNATWNSAQVQAVVQAAGPVAIAAINDYVANGGKLSSQQGAALVLQGATALAPTITSNTQLQQVIITAAVQGAGNNSVKQLATTIGHAVARNLPKQVTSVQAAQAISAAGTLMLAKDIASNPPITPTPSTSLATPAVEAIPAPTPTPTAVPTPTIISGLTEKRCMPFKRTVERVGNPSLRAI